MINDFVRLRFWSQLTAEYGEWVLTERMSRGVAELLIRGGSFPRAEIVELDGSKK